MAEAITTTNNEYVRVASEVERVAEAAAYQVPDLHRGGWHAAGAAATAAKPHGSAISPRQNKCKGNGKIRRLFPPTIPIPPSHHVIILSSSDTRSDPRVSLLITKNDETYAHQRDGDSE